MGASATQEAWRNYTKITQIRTLAMQGDYLWAGTDGGVVRWDTRDGSYTKFTTADGLAGNYIDAVGSDPVGNMWFGSSSGGVSKYDGKIMTTYSTANGLPDNYVAAITSDKAGNIWIGTSNGLSKFDGSHWTMVSSFVQ